MRLLRQIGFFGIVGITATFIHLVVAYAAIEWTSLNPFVGNGIGAFCAFWASFLGNTKMTFLYRGAMLAALFKYAALTMVSLAITSAILLITRTVGLPLYGYVMGSVIVIPPITFLLSRFWVFRADQTVDASKSG